MYISTSQFKDNLIKRMPILSKKKVTYYYKSLIEILIDRFVNNQLVIIDNFGTLGRKRGNIKRIFSVSTKKYKEIISDTVKFRPNYTFLEFFKDKKNKARLKRIIIKSSKIAIGKMKGNRKNLF